MPAPTNEEAAAAKAAEKAAADKAKEEAAAAKAAEKAAPKPTGTYLNPGNRPVEVIAGPATKAGAVNLCRPGESEPCVTCCPVSKEPLEGHYTPA